MKKRLLSFCLGIFMVLCSVSATAQKGFFDLNASYNKFTTHFSKPIMFGADLNLDGNPMISISPDDFAVSDLDVTMLNISLGYNFHLENGCYLGFYLGYSQFGADQTVKVNYVSFAPHLTYLIPLTKKITYTPNCFISAGYCITSVAENVSLSIGPISLEATGDQPAKYNFKFAINPFSFDYKLSAVASFNLTLLTPMLNVMQYTYDNEDYNQTTKDIVFLYGQVGFKFYLSKKDASQVNTKNKKRRR